MSLIRSLPARVLNFALASEAATFDVLRETIARSGGRSSPTWAATGTTLTGVLSKPLIHESQDDLQEQRPATHHLAIAGVVTDVVPGDALALGTRRFYVLDVVYPNALRTWTQLRLDERRGLP